MTDILSNEQLIQMAPSVFATKPWSGVSDRYVFIPTINVVEALRAHGFLPVRATQSRTRLSANREFTKHMLRFRHKSDIVGKKKQLSEIVELVLTNAHDRSSAYALDAGIFRMICSNGMVIKSNDFGSIHVRHSGNIIADVIAGTNQIINRAPLIREQVERWRAISLTDAMRLTLAEAALIQRYGLDDNNNLMSPITPASLLVPRRNEDSAHDLWITTNVVQENLMRGQIEGRSTSGRAVSTRAISSVNTELSINKGVWLIAEVLADRLGKKGV